MRFDDQGYIDAYMARGEFPAIHDTMADFVEELFPDKKYFMDLGSCTGLFPARLVRSLNKELVVAIETNPNFYSRRVKDLRIKWYNINISPRLMPVIQDLIQGYGIEVITARRVFPELAEAYGIEFVQDLGVMLKNMGVQILLEGRIQTKNAKAKLSSAALEVEALCAKSEYKSVILGNNCYLLV